MIELVLWRWALAVQLFSALTILVVFLSLWKAYPSVAADYWTKAWCANLAAVAVSVFYWYSMPRYGWPIAVLYVSSKTLFALYILAGALVVGNRAPELPSTRFLWTLALAFGVAVAITTPELTTIGIVAQTILGGILLGAATIARRVEFSTVGWFAGGCVLRGGLAIIEAAAYAWASINQANQYTFGQDQLSRFLAAHSVFDAVLEWALVVGCALALANEPKR